MAQELVSARLALPLLAAGQAQKEITHNEALALIDAAIAPTVESVGTTAPPATPQAGQCWIVGSAASGAWAGRSGEMAVWTQGGWRFALLPTGAHVVELSTGSRWLHGLSGWQIPPAITAPDGGAVVDSECRAAVTALLSALTAHGFIVGQQ
jgi:hypothetical protein